MKKFVGKVLLSGVIATSAMAALSLEKGNNVEVEGVTATLTIEKSDGVLTVSSDKMGTITAKIVGPDDKIVIDEKYEGDTFTWTPSGADGAYRYDVRVSDGMREAYTGGSIEIKGGQAAAAKAAGGALK